MMRIRSSRNIIVIVIFILSSNFLSCKSSRRLTIHTLDAAFSEVLFFHYSRHVYGIDPVTYTTQIDFEFQSNVIFGDATDDGRIFIADNGKGRGAWGKQIFVINNQGEILHTIDTLANPLQMKVIGNILVADSAVYYRDGYTALSFFNTKNYEKLWQSKKITNWFVNKSYSRYKNKAFIGVAPQRSMKRQSSILKVNLDTCKVTSDSAYTKRHPFDIFSMCLLDGYMIIAFNESKEIDVFALPGITRTKTIRMKDYIAIPAVEQPGTVWFFDIRPIGDSLVITIKDLLPSLHYQKLVFLNRHSFAFEKVVPIDTGVDLEGYNLCYVYNKKLFYQNVKNILVIDARSGSLLHTINLSKGIRTDF
jgi:hypothetical protein